jgi:hypothetical protein
LGVREGAVTIDWYREVAPRAYANFYREVRRELSDVALPRTLDELTREGRDAIAERCGRVWPANLRAPYAVFCAAVSDASAERWSEAVPTLRHRELLVWRLLRLQAAPYFILGTGPSESLRLRIATPWDWRQAFRLLDFTIEAGNGGQPQVDWAATVHEYASGETRRVAGHVEVRWSHGRFCGFPEAKVYLDTPHAEVPGYFALE